jgi:hypothetical protein
LISLNAVPPICGILAAMSDEPKDVRQCPQCEGTMTLVRITPKIGALPELRSYRCGECEEVITVELT